MTAQEKRRPPGKESAATTATHHGTFGRGRGETTASAAQPLTCAHGAEADNRRTADDDYVSDYQIDRGWADRRAREEAIEDGRREIIRRLFERATCATGVVDAFSPEWFALPATQQIACVALTGPQYLPEPPAKQASQAVSKALDWAAEAREPSFAELQRRRAERGPLAGLKFDPEAAQRWVETGSEVPA